jgi:hypothetical protein
MALIGINSVNPGPRKPSTLEQIAQGVEIAANVLNTGLNAYKVFGIDRKQAKLQEQKVEDDFANNMRLATPEEIGADKGTPVKGRDGLFVNQEKPDPLADIKGALLGLSVEKTKGDIKKTNKDLARSPAQEMLDSTFAKDYADFVANGGYAEIESNLKRLNAVRLALKDPKINETIRTQKARSFRMRLKASFKEPFDKSSDRPIPRKRGRRLFNDRTIRDSLKRSLAQKSTSSLISFKKQLRPRPMRLLTSKSTRPSMDILEQPIWLALSTTLLLRIRTNPLAKGSHRFNRSFDDEDLNERSFETQR